MIANTQIAWDSGSVKKFSGVSPMIFGVTKLFCWYFHGLFVFFLLKKSYNTFLFYLFLFEITKYAVIQKNICSPAMRCEKWSFSVILLLLDCFTKDWYYYDLWGPICWQARLINLHLKKKFNQPKPTNGSFKSRVYI